MELLKAILMGVVEGITEWLPISSTGHLILLEQLITFNMSETFTETFRVVVQLGAVSAVAVIGFRKLWPFTKNRETHYLKPPVLRLWLKILIACIPAAVLGLLSDDWLEAHLYNYWVVAAMLILYGVVFLFLGRRGKPTITKLSRLSYKNAFTVGLWQALSLIPGTSRSGATIVGGILLGTSRSVAAEFTFFLAIPVMLGAGGLKLIKYFARGAVFSALEVSVLLTGTVTAFIISIFSIKFLMNYVKKHSFKGFGIYRIVLGALVLSVGLLKVFVF